MKYVKALLFFSLCCLVGSCDAGSNTYNPIELKNGNILINASNVKIQNIQNMTDNDPDTYTTLNFSADNEPCFCNIYIQFSKLVNKIYLKAEDDEKGRMSIKLQSTSKNRRNDSLIQGITFAPQEKRTNTNTNTNSKNKTVETYLEKNSLTIDEKISTFNMKQSDDTFQHEILRLRFDGNDMPIGERTIKLYEITLYDENEQIILPTDDVNF